MLEIQVQEYIRNSPPPFTLGLGYVVDFYLESNELLSHRYVEI
jgi:hypothetical protein